VTSSRTAAGLAAAEAPAGSCSWCSSSRSIRTAADTRARVGRSQKSQNPGRARRRAAARGWSTGVPTCRAIRRAAYGLRHEARHPTGRRRREAVRLVRRPGEAERRRPEPGLLPPELPTAGVRGEEAARGRGRRRGVGRRTPRFVT
jgi:hypothetical protein